MVAFLWAAGGKVGIAGVGVTPRLLKRPKNGAKFSQEHRDLPLFRAARACLRQRQGQKMSGRHAVTQSSTTSLPAREHMSTSIDQVHLERMTLGDRSLEREVLEIFARQTAMTLERIAGAGPARTAAAAHTLKGSARGIGAWRVAAAAERLEHAAASAVDDAAMLAAIAELEAASFEARLAIGLRLSETDDAPAPSRGRSRDH
jgi:HPt (histidine-containing phosphotransfer) domain-containing protein